MQADEDLVCAVAAGDGTALGELCRRYERPLYRLLWRQTGGRDVDDLYQETWLRVVRAAPRFDARRRFSPWLFQIALNLCRDWHRRRAPEPAALPPEDLGATGHGSSDATEAALDAQRLLAALPEVQRSAVILRYYHGLEEDEVATILGCPRGTVKSRLHHARARLVALARGGTTGTA
jgi:RNA polymerase sigma-70 factor (ECF subfamily)